MVGDAEVARKQCLVHIAYEANRHITFGASSLCAPEPGDGVDEGAGGVSQPAIRFNSEWNERGSLRGSKRAVTAAFRPFSRRSSSKRPHGILEIGGSRRMYHHDIDEEHLTSQNDLDVRSSPVMPTETPRLHMRTASSFLDPESNGINDGIMTADRPRSPFMGKNVPWVR